MRRNLIKKLAEAGLNDKGINKNKVIRISKALKREDLKIFIKDLKNLQAKRTVTITIPSDEGISEIRNYFYKIYPGKTILFNIDPSLLTGIKVEDFDNVYELSLKNFLEQAVKEGKYD